MYDAEEKLYDIEGCEGNRLFEIISFCQKFDLDDNDVLSQMWSGVDDALDYVDEELEPKDENGHKLYAKDLREDSSIRSLIKIVNKYNLDEDIINDSVDLCRQVDNYIDSMNHARLYYDNQLYYDEKIEKIQRAYDNL